jgi:5-methylcytosine-specific restriction endonuclease McrBC regulatory subunit McrC
LNDRQTIKLQEWSCLDLPENLSDSDFDVLNQISSQGRFQLLSGLRRNTYRIQSRSWVGSLRLSKCDLIIEPKISLKTVYGMWALVTQGMGRSPLSGSLGEVESLPELVAHVFLRKLLALIQTEIRQGYRRTKKNSPVLRGRFLWKEDSIENWPMRKGVVCEYLALSPDTPAHRVIVLARNQLKQSFGLIHPEIREKIRESMPFFPACSPSQHWEADLKLAQNEPLSKLYRELLCLAELILKNLSTDLGVGYQSPLFMVDMNRLFEDYVRVILSENASNFGYQVSQRGRVRSFLCRDSEGLGIYEELPDIGVYKNGRLCHILDAKYKAYDGVNPDKEDIRQLYLYLISFQNFGIRQADLVYPGEQARPPFLLEKEKRIGFAPLKLSGNWDQVKSQSKTWAEGVFQGLSRGL